MDAQSRDSRLAARALADPQADVWLWHSDAAHRMTLLRPPQRESDRADLDSALWQPLWDAFDADADAAAALRASVETGRRLNGLRVSRAQDGGGTLAFELHAVACADAAGRFSGYVGTARACDGVAQAPTVGSAAEAPAFAGSRAFAVVPSRAALPSVPGPALPIDAGGSDLFTAAMAHDLRAPLRVILGFANILKEDYGPQIDRLGNGHLDRVLGAASRMGAMIDALLALSRISARPIERRPVDLSQMAAAVIEELRCQSPDRTVAAHIEPGLNAEGDPALLRIVLDNLLGNAWKYTARKGGSAAIRFERTRDAGRSAFAVRDNGAGFDMRYAAQLFVMFGRLHPASEFEGTGVGLASVQRIVQRHGGDIWASAEVGRGSSFCFTLAPSPPEPPPAHVPEGG